MQRPHDNKNAPLFKDIPFRFDGRVRGDQEATESAQ